MIRVLKLALKGPLRCCVRPWFGQEAET